MPPWGLYIVTLFALSCNTHMTSAGNNGSGSDEFPEIIRTQGTGNGVVNCGLTDKDGNLWFNIGGEGVYRYNGKAFINYTVKDGLVPSISGSAVMTERSS